MITLDIEGKMAEGHRAAASSALLGIRNRSIPPNPTKRIECFTIRSYALLYLMFRSWRRPSPIKLQDITTSMMHSPG